MPHSAQAQVVAPWLHLLRKAVDASGQDYNLRYLWTIVSPSTPVQEFLSYSIYHISHRTTHLMLSSKATENRIPLLFLIFCDAIMLIPIWMWSGSLSYWMLKKKLKNYCHNFSLCVIVVVSVTWVCETSLMYVISLLGSVFAFIWLAVDSTTYIVFI